MKVAVASVGKDLQSLMDPRFGRARYLVFYDTETDNMEVLDNTSASQLAHGAGIQTAQAVVNKQANVAVSGNFGPKASSILKAGKVRMAVCPEIPIAEILEMAKKHQLEPFDE